MGTGPSKTPEERLQELDRAYDKINDKLDDVIDDERANIHERRLKAKTELRKGSILVAEEMYRQVGMMDEAVAQIVRTQGDLIQQHTLIKQMGAFGELDELFGNASAILADLDEKLNKDTMLKRVEQFRKGVAGAIERQKQRTGAQRDADKVLDKYNRVRARQRGGADTEFDARTTSDEPSWRQMMHDDYARLMPDVPRRRLIASAAAAAAAADSDDALMTRLDRLHQQQPPPPPPPPRQ